MATKFSCHLDILDFFLPNKVDMVDWSWSPMTTKI